MTWTTLPSACTYTVTDTPLPIERREHANAAYALSVKVRARRTQAEMMHELQMFKAFLQDCTPNARLTQGELRLIENGLYRLIAYFSPQH